MATITVTLEDKSLIDAFNRLQAASRNMSPAMEDVASILHRWTMDNFAQQRGPDGKAWDKLKNPRPSRGENPQILQHKGHLRDSVTTRFGAAFAAIGASREYARIHQFGGAIQRAAYCGVVRLRTKNRKGTLERNEDFPNLAIFAAKRHKRFVERRFETAAYTINIPARPYLPFLGTKLQAGVEAQIIETLRRYLGAVLDAP